MDSRAVHLPEGPWVHSSRQRIAGLPLSEQGFFARRLLGLTRRNAGSETNLFVFTLLARLGRMFFPYLMFLSQVLMKGGISRVDKERIILRVAWRIGCVYEWGHHVEMARDLGLTDEDILGIAMEDNPEWDPRLRALVTATDELLRDRRVSNLALDALRDHLDENQMVEFCMLVGHYVMVAGLINTAGLQLEPGYVDEAVQ